MSENQNCGIHNLAKYDSMATEELEEILQLDAQAPEEQESDTDKILYIMEVLAERNRNSGHTKKTALEAYESFKQNYLSETDNNIIPTQPKRGLPRWVRRLTVAAAVLVILLVGSVTAKAFGLNVWKVVIQWTQETFHFGNWDNSGPNNNLSYASLQEALEKGNTPANIVPTWIPDGFNLIEIKVEQTPLKKTYKAKYLNGEKFLRITVCDHINKGPYHVEQSDGLTEEYVVLGTTYYLFSNLEYNRAMWLYGSYEFDVSGNVAIEDLKKMIDSIQKG